MLNRIEPQQNERNWLAGWESTKPLTDKWGNVGEFHKITTNMFIIITDGQAVWDINGEYVHVAFGDLIAVAENSDIEILEGGNRDLAGWQIHFRTYSFNNNEQEAVPLHWQVPVGEKYQKMQLTGGYLASISDRLSEGLSYDGSDLMVDNQLFIYELLKILYRTQAVEQQTLKKGIMRSIAYMQAHYDEVITRAQLAQIAGISQWHYSRKFGELCGKPPLDYLANYRIYRAQEEMLLTSARSQEIAKKVGFDDAQYFSRRFKHFAGVSPKNYVKTLHRRKILSISSLCAENLIALGIIPYAVMVTPALLPQHQRQLFQEHNVNLLEVKQFVIDIKLIEQQQPDLIIGNFITEDIKKKLRTIAPVITGLILDKDILLHQFAGIFDKKEEANRLQIQMKNKVNTARIQLKSILESAASVMVLRVEPFGFRYLGGYSSGVSQLLYRKLELSLPEPLKSGEAWFNPCSVELLYQANPDYLFVEKRIMENFSAGENMEKLMESSQWRNLKAVKDNRVFYIDTSIWVDGYGVVGQALIIDQIVSSLLSLPDSGAQ